MFTKKIASKFQANPEQCQQNAQIALMVSEHMMFGDGSQLRDKGVRVAAYVQAINLLGKAGIDKKKATPRLVGKGVDEIVGIGAQSVVYKKTGKNEVVKVCRSSIQHPNETTPIYERFLHEYVELSDKLGNYVLGQTFTIDDIPYRGSSLAQGLTVTQRFIEDRTALLNSDYMIDESVRRKLMSSEELRNQILEFAELSQEMMATGDFYPDLFRPENLVVESIDSPTPRLFLIDNGALGYYADRDHAEGAVERYQTCQSALYSIAQVA